MLERAKEVTRRGSYTYVEYARFADDLVILVDAIRGMTGSSRPWRNDSGRNWRHSRWRSMRRKAGWSTSPKGRALDFLGLSSGGCGVDAGAGGRWYPPKLKKRTALLRKLKEIFRRSPVSTHGAGDRDDQSDPAGLGAATLRWATPVGASRLSQRLGGKEDSAASDACTERKGFGWKRWSRQWLYGTLGLFNRLPGATATAESAPSPIGPITLDVKRAGKRSAGNPHAAFDVAGAGNQLTVRLVRHSQRKRGATDRPDLRNNGASPRPYPSFCTQAVTRGQRQSRLVASCSFLFFYTQPGQVQGTGHQQMLEGSTYVCR